MESKGYNHAFHGMRTLDNETIYGIKEEKEFFESKTGVDLGAGGGTFSKILAQYAKKLYCVDISDEAIRAMKKNLDEFANVDVVKAEENKLNFPNSSMDFVFTANSFHDLPKGYEKEISRVLNDLGTYIDFDWKKNRSLFGPPLSIRLSESEVEEKAKKVGLELVKKKDFGNHYMLIFRKQ